MELETPIVDNNNISMMDKIKNFIKAVVSDRVTIYMARRILVLIPLWFGTAVLTFAMVRSMGSPADLYQGTGRQRDVAVAI